MSDFYEVVATTAEEQTGHLIDGAAEKVHWARMKATELLEHADDLEKRAEHYRHLAALMILEAQGYAGEISDLLATEFPMESYEPESKDSGDSEDDE